MHIGHLSLVKKFDESGRQLLLLVDALTRHDIRQHVIVRCPLIASLLSTYRNVTLGQLAGSPVTAYSALPAVDIAHVHDLYSARAGLLLTLTRSTPYIISYRDNEPPPDQALVRSIHCRAAEIICNSSAARDAMQNYCPGTPVELVQDASNTHENGERHFPRPDDTAAACLRVYRRVLDDFRAPTRLP